MTLREAIREMVRHIKLYGWIDAPGPEGAELRENRDRFRYVVASVADEIASADPPDVGVSAYTFAAAQFVCSVREPAPHAWLSATRSVWATL